MAARLVGARLVPVARLESPTAERADAARGRAAARTSRRRRARPPPARTSSSAWWPTTRRRGRSWLGADGALAGARRGAMLIESSTLSPAWIDELAPRRGCARAARCSTRPVTGSRPQAATRRAAVPRRRRRRRARARAPACSRRWGADIVAPRPDRQRRAAEARQQLRLRRASRGAAPRRSRLIENAPASIATSPWRSWPTARPAARS